MVYFGAQCCIFSVAGRHFTCVRFQRFDLLLSAADVPFRIHSKALLDICLQSPCFHFVYRVLHGPKGRQGKGNVHKGLLRFIAVLAVWLLLGPPLEYGIHPDRLHQ